MCSGAGHEGRLWGTLKLFLQRVTEGRRSLLVIQQLAKGLITASPCESPVWSGQWLQAHGLGRQDNGGTKVCH